MSSEEIMPGPRFIVRLHGIEIGFEFDITKDDSLNDIKQRIIHKVFRSPSNAKPPSGYMICTNDNMAITETKVFETLPRGTVLVLVETSKVYPN
jgi:hypothetical protein